MLTFVYVEFSGDFRKSFNKIEYFPSFRFNLFRKCIGFRYIPFMHDILIRAFHLLLTDVHFVSTLHEAPKYIYLFIANVRHFFQHFCKNCHLNSVRLFLSFFLRLFRPRNKNVLFYFSHFWAYVRLFN